MFKSILLLLLLLLTTIQCHSLNETCSNNRVDINRLTKLLSNHQILYDKVYSQISRKISLQFRDAIHLKVKKPKSSKTVTTSVDVKLLKKQLRGAVGSFLEDTLPEILYSEFDKTSLERRIDEILFEYCPLSQKECIIEYNDLIMDRVQETTSQEIENSLLKLNEFQIPRLFEKTRAQITTILQHFNTMDNLNKLELRIKKNSNIYWITQEMILDSMSTVKIQVNL